MTVSVSRIIIGRQSRSAATQSFGAVIMAAILLGGCGEKPDPVMVIKNMVPEIETALNGRNIGDLRRLGTRNLEANNLIIDAFPEGSPPTLSLGFKRIRMVGEVAEMFLEVGRGDATKEPPETLVLEFTGNGRWKIDTYEFPAPEPVEETQPPDSA